MLVGDLDGFKSWLPKLPDSSEIEQHVYGMIYIMEGGKKVAGGKQMTGDEKDADRKTSAGITPDTLQAMQKPEIKR